MPQDAFTLKYVADGLKCRLTGGKISRIIQPARDSLTFIIYTGTDNVKLEACLSAQSTRLSLTDGDTAAPAVAPNFCMLLRKHLQNAEILDVVQPDFERIIYFELKCTSEFTVSVMRLYFEIMGKYSNAVLCENGIILGALKTTSIGENTRRVLFSGVKYCPPEPQDKLSPDDTVKINALLKNHTGDKADFICNNIKGISYATALDITDFYGESPTAENIRDYIFSDPAAPCVIYSDGEPCDFRVRSKSDEKKSYPDVLSAQSAYYAFVTAKRSFTEKKNRLLSALGSGVKKLDKRLAQMRAKLDECKDTELIKLKGELLTANLYAVRRGDEHFETVNYYDENCGKIVIGLDKTLTPSQNAQKYFKKYAKLKRTKTSVEAQLAEAEKQKDYLNCICAHICAAETTSDLEETEDELAALQLIRLAEPKKKKTAPPPYRCYFYEGFRILAGRNNIQNDRLTKSLAPDDLWLHTQKYHSSHVAVIARGRKVPDSVLKVAAEICAYYSDGRGGNKIPVDYALKKFVKKPPSANAGFVIYTDYSTTLADPDKHAELTEDGNG